MGQNIDQKLQKRNFYSPVQNLNRRKIKKKFLIPKWVIKFKHENKRKKIKIICQFCCSKKFSKSYRNVHDLDPNPDPDMNLDLALFFPVQIVDLDPDLHQN